MSDEKNLYAPPTADLKGPGSGGGRIPAVPFRDAGTRATFTLVGLVASPISSAIGFVLSPTLDGEPTPGVVAAALIWGLLSLVIVIGTIVAFAMWFHRVYANLPALGLETPRFTPGWVVGYFFIPILNLFRPYQAMKEAWNHSGNFPVGRSPGLVALWWGLWLAMNFVSNALLRSSFREQPLDGERTLEGISLGLDVAAAVAAIVVVVRLTRMQRNAATSQGREPLIPS